MVFELKNTCLKGFKAFNQKGLLCMGKPQKFLSLEYPVFDSLLRRFLPYMYCRETFIYKFYLEKKYIFKDNSEYF